MLEKLKILKDRFDELSDLLTKPDIISDQSIDQMTLRVSGS